MRKTGRFRSHHRTYRSNLRTAPAIQEVLTCLLTIQFLSYVTEITHTQTIPITAEVVSCLSIEHFTIDDLPHTRDKTGGKFYKILTKFPLDKLEFIY